MTWKKCCQEARFSTCHVAHLDCRSLSGLCPPNAVCENAMCCSRFISHTICSMKPPVMPAGRKILFTSGDPCKCVCFSTVSVCHDPNPSHVRDPRVSPSIAVFCPHPEWPCLISPKHAPDQDLIFLIFPLSPSAAPSVLS